MSKKCNLIATLPNLNDKRSIEEIIAIPDISSFRFNTGVNQLMSIKEILEQLKQIEEITKKKIWIDLKGRQLRIESWADPNYESITLNHDIEIEYPAKVIFRDGQTSEILRTRKNKILIKESPYHALGKGQSINIDAKDIYIYGYLTKEDKEYIRESKKLNLNNYMASFVESMNDLVEIFVLNTDANVISKIESLKGIKFALENEHLSLMAARDDLYTSLNFDHKIIYYLKQLIEKDKNAICASRIFSSLDKQGYISLSDYEDLELMYLLGYRNFMLQDDMKGPKLKRAIKGWREFNNE